MAYVESASDRSPGSAPKHEPMLQFSPMEGNGFLGRSREIAELQQSLNRSRLVTLTGPPGIGKTRLALEVVRGCGDRSAVVDLSRVADPALVASALASALSVQEVPGQTLLDTLLGYLGRRRRLVVLDNCEHVLEGCRDIADALQERSSKATLLATSREPLAIAGETLLRVPPLTVPRPLEPASVDELMGYEAVRLFTARARAVQPGFDLNAFVAPAVAEICWRLDGIPLAIELAAARIDLLTPHELVRRLDDRFHLLTTGGEDHLRHHRTLEAALDWSYDLLTPPEQAVLRRLAVFMGEFDADAARILGGGDQVTESAVAELIRTLVAKSLVVTDAGAETPRYRLLETIRAYGLYRLEQAGEMAAVRERHARFYLTLAQEAEPQLTGPSQERWFERLEADRPNFRSAVEWSLSHGHGEWALGITGALVLFWRIRCLFTEGRDLLHAALSAVPDSPRRTTALWGVGFLTLMVGDPLGAIPLLEQSYARAREEGDLQACARSLFILGNCRQYDGGNDALSLLEQSAVLAREAGDSWCRAHALALAGWEHYCHDEVDAARPLLEESLAVARRAKDRQSLRFGLLGLGAIAIGEGNVQAAEPMLIEAVAVTEQVGDQYLRAKALEYLASIASSRGDFRRAQELLESALATLRDVGPKVDLIPPLAALARVLRARGERSRARRALEEALTASPASGDERKLPVLLELGDLGLAEDHPGEAQRMFAEALELARRVGARVSTVRALNGLGRLARVEGDAARAAALHCEALELEREASRTRELASSLEAIGGLASVAGHYEHAARIFGAASAFREARGYLRMPWESSPYDRDLARIRRSLPAEQLAAAFARGTHETIEAAMAAALEDRNGCARPTGGWMSLTKTEARVAALVAEGLTNRQIAEALFISLGMVKKHLGSIFAKLGVSRRSALAREVLLWDHGDPGAAR